MVEMGACLLFPQPDGVFFTALPFLILGTGVVLGYMEVSGRNLGYSKFVATKVMRVPSKAGLFLFYFPSVLVAGAVLAHWYGVLPVLPALLKSCGASDVATLLEQAVSASDSRLLLVTAAVFAHFAKRDLESLVVHKYSGYVNVGSLIFISNAYAAVCGALLATQIVSTGLAAPSMDLKRLGFAIFSVGITGNGYHHWLLSALRKEGEKNYVVPQGGLFGLFVCPHYVFEMIMFVGIALMSQTVVGWCLVVFVMCYLTGRSISSKRWYLKKVDGFPKERCVLIPGVF